LGQTCWHNHDLPDITQTVSVKCFSFSRVHFNLQLSCVQVPLSFWNIWKCFVFFDLNAKAKAIVWKGQYLYDRTIKVCNKTRQRIKMWKCGWKPKKKKKIVDHFPKKNSFPGNKRESLACCHLSFKAISINQPVFIFNYAAAASAAIPIHCRTKVFPPFLFLHPFFLFVYVEHVICFGLFCLLNDFGFLVDFEAVL
jgi:hypothetical protein